MVAQGPPAADALARAVTAAKGADPLAPVTVAPCSTYAGLSLRRRLARASPLLNVRFLPMARVAELLGAPRLAQAGRRPLVPAVEHAAVRVALADPPPALAAVAAHPATERSMVETLRDLRDAPEGTLAELAGGSERAAAVIAVHETVRRLTAPFYDDTDLFAAAADAVAGGDAAMADIGTVVLHLPSHLRPGEAALAGALAGRGRLQAVVALTGDDGADERVVALAGRLAEWLGPPAASPCAAPQPHRALVAPDPPEEVRLVLRDTARRLEAGTPLRRMAVLYRAAEPYARLLHDGCAGAGFPFHSPPLRTLGETPAGRCLSGLLDLATGDLARRDLVAWLASAPVLEAPGGGRAPTTAWDHLSRAAGVVRGRTQWHRRLSTLEARIAVRLDGLAADPDPDLTEPDAVRERLTNELRRTRRLRDFVDELVTSLRAVPAGSWAGLAEWAVHLLVRYLGTETERSSWPDSDDLAFTQLSEALTALAVLDDVEPGPGLGAFRRATDEVLRLPAGRVGSFGEGLFVAPLGTAEGTDFDVVYVLGMTEGRFPPRTRDDALLPDRERITADGLPLRGDHRGEERRRYLAALAAGRERVVLAPRADPRAQQERAPARWFLEAASSLAGGRPMGVADVDALPAGEPDNVLRRVPSAEAGLLGGGAFATVQERDASILLGAGGGDPARHPLVRARPRLARSLVANTARRAGLAGPWTGFVTAPGAVVTGSMRPLSPTSLQDWAACPFRYFLRHLLRVGERDDPAELDEITALDRGSLVHEALQRFVAEHLGVAPSVSWDAAARRRAHEIAEELFETYETRGRTGRAVLWRHRREHLLAELDRTLDADEEHRRTEEVAPVAVEMPFGLEGRPPLEVALGDGRSVRLRGVADRVDRGADRVVVLDYKTGSARGYRGLDDDPVDRGRLLQLPAYALAARQELGDLPVAAYYWFVSDRGGYAKIGYELTSEREERFLETLRVLADGIEAGRFPARPGDDDWDWNRRRDTYENCRWCAYDAVCPTDRAEGWAALRPHPDVGAYVELAEGPPRGAPVTEPSR